MSSEEYFYHLSAKRCYQREYSVSRKKSQPMNSLTYRLFREIKTGYHLHCCKDVATSFSYIFEKKNSLRIDTGAFSCPADKQNCKCGLGGGRVQWATWTHGSLRQGGRSLSCGWCIDTQKVWDLIVTMTETGCSSYIPLRHPPCCYF